MNTLEKEVINTMIEIRNSQHKKVCEVNPETRTVEILVKGILTRIAFLPDGTYLVTELKK